MPKPPEYLTAKGKLRSKLHIKSLWEAKHGPGAGPDKLTNTSRQELRSFVKQVNRNWSKTSKIARRPTEARGLTLWFKQSFKKRRDGRGSYSARIASVLADTLPHFPLPACKMFRRGSGFASSLHPAICNAIGERTTRADGGRKRTSTLAESLNKGTMRGPHSQKFFIPYHAVKDVYTPTVIAQLVNRGVLVERVVEWTKNPKHVIKTLQKLEKQGKLNQPVIDNLRALGF